MKLERDGNNYTIIRKKKFAPIAIEKAVIEQAFDFAFNMAFGNGHHRTKRSGGQKKRTPKVIFCNTLQGKIAELVTYNYLKNEGLPCEPVDLSIHGKGVWDDADLIVNHKKINIKSAAHFSNLLLLETKDWNAEGKYLPNTNDNNTFETYDYFTLVRIEPNTNGLKLPKSEDKIILKKFILSKAWFYDFAGCCSLKTLQHIIKNNYVLPQNAMLNGTIKMDAENYYIQAGSLKKIETLVEELRRF